ncbi:MAG: hypothetical protein MRY74_05040 [Neomegalonema sp.]|nr:hypothetical protein [Neomegalonema sp.]
MLDLTTEYAETDEADAATHHAMVETPGVFWAASMCAPFAAMQEAQMLWRKNYGLARRWSESLWACRSAPEIIETNARYGERALAIAYSEGWRIVERSALMGRQAVAPASLKLRDADDAQNDA